MLRAELAHLIRASCEVLGVDEVLVLGSQTLLGRWNEHELPEEATFSREADISCWGIDDPAAIEEMSHRLSAVLGQDSQFDHEHEIYVDGVSPTTAILPAGWARRLEPFSDISTGYRTGWCLNPEDACVAKLAAGRSHDYPFVASLIAKGLVDRSVIVERAATLADEGLAARIISWVQQHDQVTALEGQARGDAAVTGESARPVSD